ncbi:hypothetical protein AA313_de0202783 [Arthrobotrys entomopaga]|nr:hypothetical protein AA313_de0202783 [Arthrobotrys entomopaga]
MGGISTDGREVGPIVTFKFVGLGRTKKPSISAPTSKLAPNSSKQTKMANIRFHISARVRTLDSDFNAASTNLVPVPTRNARPKPAHASMPPEEMRTTSPAYTANKRAAS